MSKYQKLKKYLSDLGSAAVAFSSGVDSTFLLKTAQEVLEENVIAITASSSFVPQREIDEAENFCKENNIKHIVFNVDEAEIKGFSENPKNRCYICKKYLFTRMKEIALKNGFEHIIEGSNADDSGDYRPGMQAVRELGIKSPLQIAGMTKEEIRTISREFQLSTSEKPSFACLASRFVYGETITKEKLKMVEKAEQLLFDSGFKQARVRMHGLMARIELLPDEFQKLIEEERRKEITAKFREYGFTYVSMDLEGYRTGSMNRVLTDSSSQGVI